MQPGYSRMKDINKADEVLTVAICKFRMQHPELVDVAADQLRFSFLVATPIWRVLKQGQHETRLHKS